MQSVVVKSHKLNEILLQHRISPKFVQNGRVRYTQDPIDDMNNSIGRCNVCGNYCSIYAASLYGNCLISDWSLYDVEIKFLPIGGGRYLKDIIIYN